MPVNWEQFNKNKKWINKQIARQYPGVTVKWDVDKNNDLVAPEIHLPEELLDQQDEIIDAVQSLIKQCGSNAEFYPEKAYEAK